MAQHPPTPEPRRYVTDCATRVRKRERRGSLDQERPDEEKTLQHCSAFSETFTFRFLSQLPQTLRTRGLFSAWHLCFEGYTKYPTTTLTTWRTAHDLKRGIAGASGSGLTNPGKKGDHLSQDLKRTATGVYGVQWVWDPKCDDMLMMLPPREEDKTTSLSNDPQLLGDRYTHKAAGWFWASEADLGNCSVADRKPHSLVNMGGLASPPR